MMGSTHAATGIPVGVALVGLLGGSPVEMASGAVLCAGAALASDLDHGNSCATLSHGPFTKIPSKVIVRVSKIAYRTTRTAWERSHLPQHDPGGHRYLTHTGIFALITGVITYGASAFWPVQMMIVFSLISFAIRGMTQALPGSNKIDKWPVRTLVSGLGAWLLPVTPIMLGALVSAGVLTHIGADSLTKAGVPFLWPIKIRGQRWCRLRAPFTITTGKSKAEPIIIWISMASGLAAAVYLR
jgi:hypothetical protein